MTAAFQLTSLILSLFLSMGTLLTVTLPSLRAKVSEALAKLCGSKSLEKELKELRLLLESHVSEDRIKKEELTLQKEVDKCVLRDLITGIYYQYASAKAIPMYQLENVMALYELYVKRGGNSYVQHLFCQMTEEWTVLP
jgi:hypothetical protein